MRTLIRLFRTSLTFKWWMLLAAFLGFLTVGSSIGLLMTSAYIISKAALHPSVAELQVGIVGVRFFGISRGIFRYLERLITHNTTFKLLTKFRVEFFKGLEPLAPGGLNKYKSGDLLNRIVSDVQTLEHFFVRVVAPPLVAMAVSLLMWILLRIYDPVFGLAVLLFHFAAGVIVPLLSYIWAGNTGKQILKLRAELQITILDRIQGMAELKLFGRTDDYATHTEILNKKLDRLEKRMTRISALHEAMIGLLMNGAVLTLLILAVPLISEGALNGVYLAVISLGVMASFEALLPIPESMQFLEKNLRAAEKLYEIIDAEPEIKEKGTYLSLPATSDIVIENLSFAYDDKENEVLKNIDLHIVEGAKIAVVGPSGAGKSTLINLLLRFSEYYKGSIKVGGRELKELDPEQVRSMFAVVSQNTYLFDSTIKDNLLLAKEKTDDGELQAVLKIAELVNDKDKGMPDLQTETGSHGRKLSGGERQRVAIARAVLKNSPVLLLDEATTGLDAATEQNILRTVLQGMKDKTVINITHRLVMMDGFDMIYVLRDGEIVERGRHKELISRKGFYAELWNLQQKQDVLK